MDLRSSDLFWTSRHAMDAPTLDEDLACEALVVGSGISGAFAGLLLAEAGLDVAIVDRRCLSSGSTPASTALLQYEIDTMLVDLARRIGLSAAERAYFRSHQALADVESIVRRLDDPCDLAVRNSLYLATREKDLPLFQDEARARREIGIDAMVLSGDAIKARYAIDRPGAILSARSLELNPYRLTLALLRAAKRAGARLFDQTDVELITAEPDGVLLRGNAGPWIRARDVVFATGYEAPRLLTRPSSRLLSTFAIATHPIAPERIWRDRCLIWEHDDPYFYARTTPDHRIICGGEDEPVIDPETRDALLRGKAQKLLNRLHDLFPWITAQIDHAWAGTFAQTDDGLPLIGAAPGWPRCYFALGYGGNGMTFSLIAAQIIRGFIQNQPDPDAAIFSFDRFDPAPIELPQRAGV